jgi:hypothetical protein
MTTQTNTQQETIIVTNNTRDNILFSFQSVTDNNSNTTQHTQYIIHIHNTQRHSHTVSRHCHTMSLSRHTHTHTHTHGHTHKHNCRNDIIPYCIVQMLEYIDRQRQTEIDRDQSQRQGQRFKIVVHAVLQQSYCSIRSPAAAAAAISQDFGDYFLL